ncbi:MAG: DUF4838 domain-containing protein [Clostridia bacterium]|nr:DUF4838 domain-containing protein [Clostridia bacterium]
MKIAALKCTETIEYALCEFVKYFKQVDDTIEIEIVSRDADITFGLLSELGLPEDDVTDPMYDDVVDVKIDSMRGYIAGSNERSVLFGVYNFFKSLGCMWVRPGKEGEYIPKRRLAGYSFRMRKKADKPFRGQCIEGADSYENLCDTIEWLPKVNANLFMMEQVVPYNYISRWYKHEVSTRKQDENVSFEEIEQQVIRIEKLIRKCGLQLHSLGHGYLFEPYGVHYKTTNDKYELPCEAREDVALVGGKREFFRGSPNFTQLCFSKDKARLGLVKFLVEYLEKKPYIDFLHVWLSDALGNQCECENCTKKIPTDFYVQLLNELDAELTKKGVDTKIVFIMYNDTHWPPEITRFVNPDRFILTTAAQGRNHSTAYEPVRFEGELPKYVRNRDAVKRNMPLILRFADEWKPIFDGPKFLFEYHMYLDHYLDPGYMSIGREVLEDCKHVGDIGFDGIMCNQTQRCYFPTALPCAIMGEGLFDTGLDFDDYADKYFKAAYGEEWKDVRNYLEAITATFDPSSLRVDEDVVVLDTATGKDVIRNSVKNNPDTARRLSNVFDIVDDFMPSIERNMNTLSGCHKESYRILYYHAEYCKRVAEVMITLARGDVTGANALFDGMIDYLSEIEDEIQPYFDLYLIHRRFRRILDK